jgi:hypothetical protein
MASLADDLILLLSENTNIYNSHKPNQLSFVTQFVVSIFNSNILTFTVLHSLATCNVATRNAMNRIFPFLDSRCKRLSTL